MIPVLNIKQEIQPIRSEIDVAIKKVVDSGYFINGPQVKAFESAFASYLGVSHAVAVNSGTDALLIALRSLGVGVGDEVIVPAFSFFATSECVGILGAEPVFVDICPKTFNIDAGQIERVITSKTKAIIPVHLFGQSANMHKITELAEKHGLRVLEDVAQCLGGKSVGRKCGSIGDISAFSFFPSKTLGAFGDGGMIATNDRGLADECRLLKNHGGKHKYNNEKFGYNSRLDEIQAAILNVKLQYLDDDNLLRLQVGCRYNEMLSSNNKVVLPYSNPSSKHVFHQYTVQIKNANRDAVQSGLLERGIQTMVYYPKPLYKLPVYEKTLHFDKKLPNAERAAETVLSLPCGSRISEKTQVEVVEALEAVLKKAT